MLEFLFTCFAVELTPGPNMAFLTLLSALRGRKAGFLMVGGIATGLLIVGLAAAIGAQSLLAAYPQVYSALKWAGIFYMLWLAYDAWKGSDDEEGNNNRRDYFTQGLITNLLNPKAFIFYFTILPHFASQPSPSLHDIIGLTLIYVAVATAVHAGLVLGADHIRPFLITKTKQKIVGRVFALLLAGIAMWLVTK
jgi:threonine/homoserine/homoserine lactone efflux protein